jgi:hypothetical protein
MMAGTGVQHPSESVFTLNRNACSRLSGTRTGAESSVSITCERLWRGGRHTSVYTLWEDRTQLLVPPSRSVPVDFAIPYDLPSSDAPGSAPGKPINWYVTVRVNMPGVGYEALFQNLPVFATEASDPSFVRGTAGASAAFERPAGERTEYQPQATSRISDQG